MASDTNAAWRTMRGAKYELAFMGDKGKAYQYLCRRYHILSDRIEGHMRQAQSYGMEGSFTRQWLREDQNELGRVRLALRSSDRL